MTNLETYFKNSQPLNEYIDGMKTNQDTVLSIYQSMHGAFKDFIGRR